MPSWTEHILFASFHQPHGRSLLVSILLLSSSGSSPTQCIIQVPYRSYQAIKPEDGKCKFGRNIVKPGSAYSRKAKPCIEVQQHNSKDRKLRVICLLFYSSRDIENARFLYPWFRHPIGSMVSFTTDAYCFPHPVYIGRIFGIICFTSWGC
jgi:hypothetical protein